MLYNWLLIYCHWRKDRGMSWLAGLALCVNHDSLFMSITQATTDATNEPWVSTLLVTALSASQCVTFAPFFVSPSPSLLRSRLLCQLAILPFSRKHLSSIVILLVPVKRSFVLQRLSLKERKDCNSLNLQCWKKKYYSSKYWQKCFCSIFLNITWNSFTIVDKTTLFLALQNFAGSFSHLSDAYPSPVCGHLAFKSFIYRLVRLAAQL